MLPAPQNYAVWPAVVPADTLVQMTVAPTGRAFLLTEGEEYRLTVISVDVDETSYHEPVTHRALTAVAHGGVLAFEYAFPGEMEHMIILEQGERKLGEMVIYSLKEDLYALDPLKGDLHGHSFRSDGKRDPAALAGYYREQGYDFFALTDHNRFYPGGEIDEVFKDVEMPFFRVSGEEVHAPGSVVHIVHVGGRESVADRYVHDREGYEAAAEEYMQKVPETIPENYRERYAKAMWATDCIHAAGGLAIFPHPFWRPGKSKVHNVCADFARILLRSGMFDAYELIGGNGQPGNNRAVALWMELREEGVRIPVVGSSDVHGLEKSSTFPHLFTICFAKDQTQEAVIEAVKNGLTVAVEATGTEYERHFRCYGSYRLVTYAQFLLKHFFQNRQRICQGEGSVMRAYANGEAPAELVTLLGKQSAAYRARFFGKSAPTLPTQEMLTFEAKWRETHLNGPITKGSSIDPPMTRQI